MALFNIDFAEGKRRREMAEAKSRNEKLLREAKIAAGIKDKDLLDNPGRSLQEAQELHKTRTAANMDRDLERIGFRARNPDAPTLDINKQPLNELAPTVHRFPDEQRGGQQRTKSMGISLPTPRTPIGEPPSELPFYKAARTMWGQPIPGKEPTQEEILAAARKIWPDISEEKRARQLMESPLFAAKASVEASGKVVPDLSPEEKQALEADAMLANLGQARPAVGIGGVIVGKREEERRAAAAAASAGIRQKQWELREGRAVRAEGRAQAAFDRFGQPSAKTLRDAQKEKVFAQIESDVLKLEPQIRTEVGQQYPEVTMEELRTASKGGAAAIFKLGEDRQKKIDREVIRRMKMAKFDMQVKWLGDNPLSGGGEDEEVSGLIKSLREELQDSQDELDDLEEEFGAE